MRGTTDADPLHPSGVIERVVEVELGSCRGEVTRTLHVGDEPRDIVVAATGSGAALTATPRAQAARTAEQVLERLGLTRARVDELRNVSVDRLLAAMRPADGQGAPLGFGPVVDESSLSSDPFTPTAPALSPKPPGGSAISP